MNDEIPALKEKLEKVLNHNQAELKELYREQILSKRTDDNNAGLGIIDIAIKSGNLMQYEFKDGVNSYLATANSKMKVLADVIAFNKENKSKNFFSRKNNFC